MSRPPLFLSYCLTIGDLFKLFGSDVENLKSFFLQPVNQRNIRGHMPRRSAAGENNSLHAFVKKANADASEILLRAEEDVARMKRVALEEMKDDLTDLAVQIARKVLGDAVDQSTLEASAAKYTDEVIEAEVKKSE